MSGRVTLKSGGFPRAVDPKARRKRRRDPHVVILPHRGSALLCRHCGESYAPTLPAPVPIVTAIWKTFEREHRTCALTDRGRACGYCLQFGHEPAACPDLETHGDPYRWLRGPDTGVSSKTIWAVMMGNEAVLGGHGPDIPYDPADFGRCHRLLTAIPSWRPRLGEMGVHPGWGPLVDAWDELEALYVEELPSGAAPKLYARMRALRGET